MATRIRPLPAPAEPAAPHLDPGAALLLAPPGNLNKRLRSAVHRSLPGWTVEVMVKRWTDDEVRVVLKGTRDPGSGAPSAPPTDSPAARKIEERTSGVLERVVEAAHPGVDWRAVSQYQGLDADHFVDIIVAKPHDPPTCPDGAVIFPDDAQLVGMSTVTVSNMTEVDHWVFFHRFQQGNNPLPTPLTQSPAAVQSYGTTGWSSLVRIHAPRLVYQGNDVVLHSGDTYAYLLHAGNQLALLVAELTDWWVWDEAVLSVRYS